MTTKPKGVMIKGMEMPRTCIDCPCARAAIVCHKDKNYIDFICQNTSKRAYKTKRPSWCPLQDVKQ